MSGAAIRHPNPDSIYIFQPAATAFGGYPIVGGKARFGLEEVANAFDILGQGGPVPEECIPESLVIKKVHDRMPDFYYLRDCEIIVSSRAREALDVLTPGAIQYVEIKMEIDPSMRPADAYYYINVLPKLKMIDLAASQLATLTSRHPPQGPIHVVSIAHKGTIFKTPCQDDSRIWHDISEDIPYIRSGIKRYVLMRGDLWHALSILFPDQLLDWRWPEF